MSYTTPDTTSFYISQRIAPMDTLWGRYGTNIYLRTQSTCPVIIHQTGFEGINIHSGLFSYNVSSGIFLLIGLIYAYLIPRATKIFKDGARAVFQKKMGRSSLFEEELGAIEFRYRLVLLFLGVLGFTTFLYPFAASFFPHADIVLGFVILAVTFIGVLLFFGIKWLSFRLLEFVFFVSDRRALQFRNAYFSMLVGLGFCILPLMTAESFVSIGLSGIFNTIILILCGIFFFLILYKIVQLFWNWHDSIFYILLYLCTLEILPVLVSLQMLKQLSFVLQIK